MQVHRHAVGTSAVNWRRSLGAGTLSPLSLLVLWSLLLRPHHDGGSTGIGNNKLRQPFLARADKDDSYYVAGTGNPNVEETMYWKDAENILQDLHKFSSLHVVFHQCAWTWMQPTESDNNVDENDYWYMAKIPPMGANVAFSLYGSLTGRTFTGCSSDTFINSFYTKTGFEVFAKAMQSAGVSGFNVYSYAGDDDATSSSSSSSSQLTSSCLGYSGVGCNANYGFAVHSYSSALCDPQTATAVTDNLAYLNKAMESSKCIKIYSTSGSYGSSYYSSSSSSSSSANAALNLLSYSSACFYQNFWSPDGECPDPYGKIKYYQNNFYKGIQKSQLQRPVAVYKQKQIYEAEIRKGQSRLVFGVICLMAAIGMLVLDRIWSWCCRKLCNGNTAAAAAAAAEKKTKRRPSVGSTAALSHQSPPESLVYDDSFDVEYRPYR
jgi:hypothetical protein